MLHSTSARRLVVAALLSLAAWPAHAFKLTPIEMSFAPAGRAATQTFLLSNDSPDPAAIEIHMYTREMDEAGKDKLTKADNSFVVFPDQIILKHGQEQAVRVQWIGNPAPSQELAFRLIAEQLPINLNKTQTSQGGQMKLLVRYVASIYVDPKGVAPKIVLASAGPAKTASGKTGLALVFSNTGTAHALLANLQLTITDGHHKVVLTRNDLDNVAGENVLAGHKRRFVIPWPAGIDVGDVKVSFSYSPNQG